MTGEKYIRVVLMGVVCVATSCTTLRHLPAGEGAETTGKREFRGAWIQTAFQGEYKDMTPEEMRQSFVRKLDCLKGCGINAVIFQVRPEADAFYKSDLEPWSRFYTGEQGLAPEGDFDVMAFLIEECHRRGMEFHAWLNPYRAGTAGATQFAPSHICYTHPEWFVTYNKQMLFDPGMPQCREFICGVVRDIVSRYDVDAIHMDDYFYPYPVAGMPFPDERSFQLYGMSRGYTEETRGDWRRENVNALIRELKHTIVSTKPWVRFGISPFGIYRNRQSTTDGSGSDTNGLQNYDDLYADVLRWVNEGWIDYNIPQIYWEIGHPAADYVTLILWWSRRARPEGTHLYIGQDVARTMRAGDLTRKMICERRLPNVKGNCFWPANELLWNNTGVADSLRLGYHRYPALIPAYTHMHSDAPQMVRKLKKERTDEGYVLHWEAGQSICEPEKASYFVVYRFDRDEPIDLRNPANIEEITRDTYLLIPCGRERKKREKCCYVVTAVNRFHNESEGRGIRIKL